MELALPRGRAAGPVALLIACALVFVSTGYAIGLIQTLGFENRRITFSGFASGTGGGGGFGLKTMLFFKGQTAFVDYDVEIREGAFRLVIDKYLGGMESPRHTEEISSSGSGEAAFPIPETGVYSFRFDGSPRGNGYDLSYSVRWGAR
jgi:hypothetical protein